MSELVRSSIVDRVAVIEIDNPPVNALSAGVPEGLAAAVERAQQDASVRALVVVGAGRTFIAGADINELERAAWGDDHALPDLHGLLQRIEDGPKPVVMALHGTALGGGLEVAMAGHYRVAVPDARMGQPEVNLGIIPGAEGTQRLTRLVGVEKALDMCVSGKPIAAAEALESGLVDRLIEGDLRTGAAAFAREMAVRRGAPPKTRERTDKLGTAVSNAPLYAAGRELAAKTRRRLEAPLAVIGAIEAAASLPFEEGCRREREIFVECVRSEQCKALVHAFFAERGASRVPDVPKDTPTRDIATVAIVGAGTMGAGIAMASVNAGFRVILIDTTERALEAGMGTIRHNYDSSVKRRRFTPEAVAERVARIRPQVGYGGCEAADLVIEAVFENMALKKQVFAEIDAVAKPGAVLATNTSTLNIDEIAAATSRPESVVGLHFFSPANVMRLVEIVRGRATGRPVIATAMALAKRLGKVGVLVGNGPGFVGNRMMFPYMYEAQFLVEDGATPEQVDRALTSWGMAMGIFAVDDMAGLDVAWRVRRELRQFADAGGRRPLVADRLVEAGRLGQKTGKGWYLYGEDRKPQPDREVIDLIERAAAEAGIHRGRFTDEEIVERTIYALINEGAKILEEGLALRAADIDVIYMNGYGFPAWRGGPMFYADRVGLPAIHAKVAAFHREFGDRWAPAPLLETLATQGKTFNAAERGQTPS
ncbi:MAG: enoyl-CoA hydratase/isomerase family protein [Gemmatimonadetes bacterium]|nr:enoyl-CoA hydratase/isomerase family protein [Gemmatimonadota bacterium]